MKTQVEFRSRKFPPYEGEEEQINPGLWGKRLAEYLVQKLSERGIKTEKIVAEDWGYYIPVQNQSEITELSAGADRRRPWCSLPTAAPSSRNFPRWRACGNPGGVACL